MRLQPINFGQPSFRGTDTNLTLEIREPKEGKRSFVDPNKVEAVVSIYGKPGCTILLDSRNSIELKNVSEEKAKSEIGNALKKINTMDTAVLWDK